MGRTLLWCWSMKPNDYLGIRSSSCWTEAVYQSYDSLTKCIALFQVSLTCLSLLDLPIDMFESKADYTLKCHGIVQDRIQSDADVYSQNSCSCGEGGKECKHAEEHSRYIVWPGKAIESALAWESRWFCFPKNPMASSWGRPQHSLVISLHGIVSRQSTASS